MHSYLKTVDSDWYNRRLTSVFCFFMAAFALLIVRLFYLQVIDGEELRRLSENNCIRLQHIDSPRGLIFDRNGKLLVDNRPSFDLSIVLNDSEDIDLTLKNLAKYLPVSVSELKKKIEKKKVSRFKPVILKRNIGRDALAVIELHKFDLPGVLVNVRPLRNYVFKESAAHLIGYLSEINADELRSGTYEDCRGGDYIGRFGSEKFCERFLRGKRGGRQVEVNAAGRLIKVLKTVDAQPGFNVYLTIDSPLQQKAEELLAGKAGAVGVMETSTGHVLALASSPSFNPNLFASGMSSKQWKTLVSNPFRPMENKVVQGQYPPASVYKIITAMAGLEEGIIDKNTLFECSGRYKHGNRTYRCWKHWGHGQMDVVAALSQSCDVFFYNVGKALGVDKLAWYASACGLGKKTGIMLDKEGCGLIPTAAWKKRRIGMSWQSGETISVAIGQSYNLVTPLQVLVLTGAIANGGIIYEPSMVKRIDDSGGKIVYKRETKVVGRLPCSEKILKIIKKGLWEVVNTRNGTAWGARLDEIEFSGKTGTAQVVSRTTKDMKGGVHESPFTKPHAWFAAYAPSVNSEIAVVVLVEHGEHGSSAAAPIARELIKTYLVKSRDDQD
ncbi:MAG TPA: penicillin-binding protein 2 [Desulfobacteraceae bacterium]|nr:penicillin-binding protein 2 [Desulfobacteraceae bacterium]